MVLKKGDFVRLDYTGRLKESLEVFDTTLESEAKKAGIHSEGSRYAPVAVCIGAGHLLPGLDSALEGKEPNTSLTVAISPEAGFGKKEPKLLKLIATSKFKKQGITPIAGLRIDIDGLTGVVRAVTGGRTIVDFNHPLAGRELLYEVKLHEKIEEPEEQLACLVNRELFQEPKAIELKEGVAKIKLERKLPQPIWERFSKRAMEAIPSLKGLEQE